MTTLRLVVCAVAAAVLLLPSTASAAPPRTAQEFASAAQRLHITVALHAGTIQRSVEAQELGRCERVLARRRVPPRVVEDVASVFASALFQGVFVPLMAPLQQFVADLEAVPTRDPLLRSGRAGWRSVVAEFAATPVLERPCEALERWARAGYTREAAPDFPFAELRRAWMTEPSLAEHAEHKIVRAARRLRGLGMGRRAAGRFTAEHLLDGVVDLDDLSGDLVAGEASSPSTR